MKPESRTIALVFAMMLAASQIQCAGENNQPAIDYEVPSGGVEPRIILKVKYPTGRYRMIQSRSTDTRTITHTAPKKRTRQIKRKTTQWMSVDVRPEPAGVSTLAVQFDRIRREISDGPKKMTLDTADKPSPGAKMFSAIIGAKVTMKCDIEGRITDAVPPAEKTPQETSAAAEFKESVAVVVNKTREYLPGGPVGVGAIWYVNPNPKANQIKCKLVEIRKTPRGRIAVIQVSAQSAPAKPGAMKMKWTGRIEMNADTGLMTEISTSMDGEISGTDIAEGKSVATETKTTGAYEITLTPIE
ncbi:MAG: hypothetical protein QGH60_16955 [Phycisphaerae bacterium]|jgi:hypothetical protein|nr:hypothetical protein [Phycisphaerae bacterium]